MRVVSPAAAALGRLLDKPASQKQQACRDAIRSAFAKGQLSRYKRGLDMPGADVAGDLERLSGRLVKANAWGSRIESRDSA